MWRDLYQHVQEVQGTISGEHGDGLSRSFSPQQYGPLFDVFRQIKRPFDPHYLLNPGKNVGDARSRSRLTFARWITAPTAAAGGGPGIQRAGGTPPASAIPLQLVWDPGVR